MDGSSLAGLTGGATATAGANGKPSPPSTAPPRSRASRKRSPPSSSTSPTPAPSSTRYRRATASARCLPPPSPGRAPAIDPLPWPGPIHRPPESRRPRPRLRSGEPIPRSSPVAGSTQASVGDPAGSTVASPARTCPRRHPTCDVTSEHRADSGDEAPGRSGSSDIPALGGHGRWMEMDAVMAPDLAYTDAASLKPVSRTGVGNGGPIAGFETAWQACTCAGRCAGPVR